MIVIKVWCLPSLKQSKLQEIFKAMVSAVVSIIGLGVKSEKDLLILFPKDMMSYGAGTEILIEITNTEGELEFKTARLRLRLVRLMGITIKNFFPETKITSIMIKQVIRYPHFWSSATSRE